MKGNTQKILRKLSPKQASALISIIQSPDGRGEFDDNGHGLGGVLSALYRNKLISPLGKINRRIRWEIAENLKKDISENKKQVIELLIRISIS